MACIREEIPIQCPASVVWDAIADTGAIHKRLARGFVTDTHLDDGTRLVTFVSGAVVRELLVDLDHDARRLAYAVIESPLRLRHHHASMQVVEDGKHCSRLLWIADIAPDEAAATLGPLMREGAVAMQHTLEGVSR
jgi:hypothetical protein